jgi:hypothetical protein
VLFAPNYDKTVRARFRSGPEVTFTALGAATASLMRRRCLHARHIVLWGVRFAASNLIRQLAPSRVSRFAAWPLIYLPAWAPVPCIS